MAWTDKTNIGRGANLECFPENVIETARRLVPVSMLQGTSQGTCQTSGGQMNALAQAPSPIFWARDVVIVYDGDYTVDDLYGLGLTEDLRGASVECGAASGAVMDDFDRLPVGRSSVLHQPCMCVHHQRQQLGRLPNCHSHTNSPTQGPTRLSSTLSFQSKDSGIRPHLPVSTWA